MKLLSFHCSWIKTRHFARVEWVGISADCLWLATLCRKWINIDPILKMSTNQIKSVWRFLWMVEHKINIIQRNMGEREKGLSCSGSKIITYRLTCLHRLLPLNSDHVMIYLALFGRLNCAICHKQLNATRIITSQNESAHDLNWW